MNDTLDIVMMSLACSKLQPYNNVLSVSKGLKIFLISEMFTSELNSSV